MRRLRSARRKGHGVCWRSTTEAVLVICSLRSGHKASAFNSHLVHHLYHLTMVEFRKLALS